MTQPAVIYCRVSSNAQVKKGDGLQSQETRCREYASHCGYSVVAVFQEEGITGKITDRPRMQEMLRFLRQRKKKETHVVIIDDISRLARDLKAHIELRTLISDAGGKLESPSIEFGEDSDSRLIEHMLATVAAHQREKNAEQVKNRMRARMMNGYWVFQEPVGYKYKRVDGHGKILVKDEPVARLVKEALESYASGRFENQTEIKRFLDANPVFPKTSYGVRYQKVQEMLERVLYTGFIDHPEWDINLLPGKHEPIISFDTWQKIQLRLKEHTKTPNRKDISLDFPLRGFVLCDTCREPMTSCWAKGRHGGKYAYYHCRNGACADAKKSIPKGLLETEFETVLKEQLCIKPEIVFLAKEIWQATWDQHHTHHEASKAKLQEELRRIDHKTEQFLNRIIETDSPTLVQAYENQVRKLEQEKRAIAEKMSECGKVRPDFKTQFQTAMHFLENPLKMWGSGELHNKRALLKMAFAEQLPYKRNFGFQTPALALPFLFLQALQQGNYDMAEGMRFETAVRSQRYAKQYLIINNPATNDWTSASRQALLLQEDSCHHPPGQPPGLSQ